MHPPIPRVACLGALEELRQRPDAELLAVTRRWSFGDYTVTRYKSRKALEVFCKDGSAHVALIKHPVHPNMLTNRNTQYPKREDS